METIIGSGEVKSEEKNIKCFMLASGMNVITEYEEVKTEEDIDLYFLNPMVAAFGRTPDQRVIVVMSPLIIFSKDVNRVGPINPCVIIAPPYKIETKYENMYENKVIEVREARLGLVKGSKVDMNKLKQQLKIGEGLKISR